MKRSMIAVCLLLLSPGTVMACIEDQTRARAGSISSRQDGRVTAGRGCTGTDCWMSLFSLGAWAP